MDVVRVYDACSAETAHDLSEYEAGDLAPRKVAERSKRDRDSGINVPARDTARNPDAEGSAYRNEEEPHGERKSSRETLPAYRLPIQN